MHRSKSEPPMTARGHLRQIDTLPTLPVCPLRSNRLPGRAAEPHSFGGGFLFRRAPGLPQLCHLSYWNRTPLAPFIYRGGREAGRGEQGRRVPASRARLPRDGAHIWRPRRADYTIPHGTGLAAAGRRDRVRAEASHSPASATDSAQGRRQSIAPSLAASFRIISRRLRARTK